MADTKNLDPTDSVATYFAVKLREHRERVGIGQREYARMQSISPSLQNKIERATRLPTREQAVFADATFGTGETFTELWPLVIKFAYPAWFRPYVDLERDARSIRDFENQVIPGLLQTGPYTQAMLQGLRVSFDVIEDRLAARQERQRLFQRDNPPDLWFVLDENVVRRTIGTPDVMRGQLKRLIEAAESPTTVIQVVPYSAGAHPGMDGPFTVLALDEGPDVLAVEGFKHGQLLGEVEQVRAAERTYDLLAAVALSPAHSIELIARIAKDLST